MYFAVTAPLECTAAQKDEANLVGSGGCDFRVPNATGPRSKAYQIPRRSFGFAPIVLAA